VKAIVFGGESGTLLEGRTVRSLREAGIAEAVATGGFADLGAALRAAQEPLLLLEAGTWLSADLPLPVALPSATGRPLIGIGAIRAHAIPGKLRGEADEWTAFLRRSGGDFNRLRWWTRQMPQVRSLYLEPEVARALGSYLAQGKSWIAALRNCLRSTRFRAVHLPSLDVHFDPDLRIVQLVTTIQIGGAERVTLDLAAELRGSGLAVCVAAFGKPTRLAFPTPANFADLSEIPYQPEERAAAVARLCRSFGADLVHAHLIRAREAQAIRSRGLPLAMTIHNMPQSWPAGLLEGGGGVADLFLACSNVVAGAACGIISSVPIRTVWNGIDPLCVAPSADRTERGRELRTRFGISESDIVLVAVANPRRQKRLDRLPEIVRALQSRLVGKRAHLLLAGAPAAGNRDAEEAVAALTAAIEAQAVQDCIHWTGPVLDIAPVLAASDVLVSVSEFEGLSLAHLEALAAGLPVVATDVGGTREIAAQSAGMRLVPQEAEAAEVVSAVEEMMAGKRADRVAALPKSFTRYRMARRYQFFYGRAIERCSAIAAPRRPQGIWLITNNFSTGGAQSSARRLLIGLAAQGVKVRAAVVQEHPERPTTGRRALLEAGVPVKSIPPPGVFDAEEAVELLAREIAADPPEAVVFWNLLASYKLLLADGLLDSAVYDVSPGEMYFESLSASFAQPRAGLPFLSPREYGSRLAGAIVKYKAEAARAEEALGASVHVIRNGVPLLPLRSRPATRNRRLIFGTAARLSPQKRIEDLLEAVRLAQPDLPPFTLRIAGGVETGQAAYAKSLRRQARGLPVEWCGELADTSDFLQDLDLFLMISEPAGCPNASLEAMAAGLPVVATDVGGAAEQVVHERTGLLVPSRDPKAFAEAVRTLACDAGLGQTFGANGREHIAAHFSLERMLRSYAKVFGVE